MGNDLALRRKWTLRAHGRQMVFVKRPHEQTSHVVMKALLWGLYLPHYPDLSIETPLADRYEPDVVSIGADRHPQFWGEAGQVTPAKIRSLARRYRKTHFAISKWATRLAPHLTIIEKAIAEIERSAPFDLLIFPEDAADRFIDESGTVRVTHDDLEWVRIEP
ncbi:MAG TPA: hypothetical protein VG826_26770 [Pirellulales bacterium]|nr:hypothetical protein [Pirellulales bacterium]